MLFRSLVNTVKINIAMRIAISVLWVRCTTTLSVMACVNSGVASATTCSTRDASNTLRQTCLCLSSSGTNQPKPKRREWAVELPAGASGSTRASGCGEESHASPEHAAANSSLLSV